MITAIELENFQSIEKRTRIELRPVTLLFGPNSAGKSAVFDALELLRVILDPAAFDQDLAADMLDRWASTHDQTKDKDIEIRRTALAIEFTEEYIGEADTVINNKRNWPAGKREAFVNKYFDSPFLGDGKIFRIDLSFSLVKTLEDKEISLSEFSVSYNKNIVVELIPHHPLLGVTEISDSSYNVDHPENGGRYLIIKNLSGARFCSDFLREKISKYTRNSKRYSFYYSYEKKGIYSYGGGWVKPTDLSPRKLSPMTIVQTWSSLQAEICQNVSEIFFYLGVMIWHDLRESSQIVRADRRSPDPGESTALVDFGLTTAWWLDSDLTPAANHRLTRKAMAGRDYFYQGLAELAHASFMGRWAKDDKNNLPGSDELKKRIENKNDETNSSYYTSLAKKADAFDRINHHLQKSLFTEKLYQLASLNTLLVPIDLDDDKHDWDDEIYAHPALVRLFLKDGAGNKLEFRDVGSGIPFILPVLYAVSLQGLVKIQQPELHLHPALQSSIADIFVEELHRPGCGQFLIETHSEHFLLRLLRRIRDTTKGKSLTEESKLTNEQISVYYFDPQVSGGTQVTRQLVTPLGDFYNEWPRGFFAERDGDLFE